MRERFSAVGVFGRSPNRGARRISGRLHRQVAAWRMARRGARAEQPQQGLRFPTFAAGAGSRRLTIGCSGCGAWHVFGRAEGSCGGPAPLTARICAEDGSALRFGPARPFRSRRCRTRSRVIPRDSAIVVILSPASQRATTSASVIMRDRYGTERAVDTCPAA